MHDIGSEYPTDRRLHAGELAAIALAVALKADLVLMDDRAGAVAARANGLNVTGTLGELDLAARSGLVDLDTAFERLKATNFRYRPAMLDDMLMDWRESRGQ
jgi:predicted nucleic acid-binding protein